MSREREILLAHLEVERAHVLSAVEGLSEAQLVEVRQPQGWSVANLLNHLTFDDEVFWGCAIVGGDPEAIAQVQDGWAAPVLTGAQAVADYRRWSGRSRKLLSTVDLDSTPRWWPPMEVFPFPPFPDVRSCVLRLLVETATHAGHLDIVREGIDGHRHLVLD